MTDGKIDYEKMQEAGWKRYLNRADRPESGYRLFPIVIYYGKDGL